ncbi:hypothetical protein BJ165DRAFT_1119625 [Panaeolus papilionaceus]|nr:hypothetical protein BJ165DRAFT_1119625 [Panaeolus papilionaceus]
MNTSSSHAFIPTPPYKHLKYTSPVSVLARPKNELFSSLEKSQAAFILLLGPTGSGKSTFIEALAEEGSALGISKNQLDSVTQDIVSYQLVNVHQKRDHDRKHDEYTFHIIDTPGFSDNALSELKVFNMLVEWMERLQGPPADDSLQRVPQGLKELGRRSVIDHILYFHPITDPRIPGSKSNSFRCLRRLPSAIWVIAARTIMT